MQTMEFLPNLNLNKVSAQNLVPFFTFLGGILLVNLFQIWYLPFINLADGLGYDGSWYLNSTNTFLPPIDDYHLFRVLPATLVYGLKCLFGFGDSTLESVKMFQYFNLGTILLSLVIIELICRFYSLSQNRKWIFYIFIYLNFHVLKDSVFNPVMTDSFAFFLALGLFYFTASNKKIWFIFFILLAFFTMPIMCIVYLSERILRNFKFSNINSVGKINLTRVLSGTLILGFTSLTSFLVLYLGRTTIVTFPDKINLGLFPLALVGTSVAIFFIFEVHSALFKNIIYVLKQVNKFFTWEFGLLLILSVVKSILAHFNGMPPNGFRGIFIFGAPIYITLKPLIGIIDNIGYFGVVIIFFFIFLPNFIATHKSFISIYLLTLISCFFMLKPEARHGIMLLPLVGFLVTVSIPEKNLNRSFLILILGFGILFSKVWYPVHLAWFPPGYLIFTSAVNHDIFQEFPAQHYFMFQGPMMSHAAYFFWLAVESIAAIILFKQMPGLYIMFLKTIKGIK
jgi:hypothetical protein